MEVLPGHVAFPIVFLWTVSETAFDQTEVKVDISIDSRQLSNDDHSLRKELEADLVSFGKQFLAQWFADAITRSQHILDGNFDAVVSSSPLRHSAISATSPPDGNPSPSSPSGTVGGPPPSSAPPKFDRSRCGAIRHNWSVVLLVVVLSLVIPLMSILFYRINVINSNVDRVTDDIANLLSNSN
jgi:hypothetical protein